MINDVYKFNKEIIGLEEPNFKKAPKNLTRERLLFALIAMYEELNEFTVACNSDNVGEALDALIDLIYFAIGRAYEMGITEEQFKLCWDAVQNKNMSKKRGTKNRGTDCDAAKPEGWVAADVNELLGIK